MRDTVDQKAFAHHRRKPHPQAVKRSHVWKGKILSWAYCTECGLIGLKNATTRACEAWGCWHMPD